MATVARPRVTGAWRRAAVLLAISSLVATSSATVSPPRVVAVTASPSVAAVDGGGRSTCAVLTDGTVRCWGQNDSGQLGNGRLLTSIVPVPVSGITGATAVAVSTAHACARLADGHVRCWGASWSGQLGTGAPDHAASVPVTVYGITTAVDVAAGDGFSCALLEGGSVSCWGSGEQLGNGGSGSSFPLPVDGIDDAVALDASGWHACALRAGGAVECWGENDYGQLGDGTLHTAYLPTPVAGLMDAVAIATGTSHTCAIRAGGTVECWGATLLPESGVVPRTSPLPTPIAGLAGATSLAAGVGFTCALLGDGTASCWGGNASGSLGDGTTVSSADPVTVSGLSGAVALGTGTGHACAVLADQSLACWGENGGGQVGDRTVTDRSTPVAVRWDPDATPPTMTAIRFEVISAYRPIRESVVRIGVRLAATDGADGTGIDHYVVQKSRNGGEWVTIRSRGSLAKSAVGTTGIVRYRAFAYDRAGNRSAWFSSRDARVRVVDDDATSVQFGRGWARQAYGRAIAGSTHYTRAAGSSVSYTFTGWSLGPVTITSAYRGELDAYVDGTFVTRFETRGSKGFRKLLGGVHWATRGTHTVTLVAVGTAGRPRVDVDALVVIR